MQIHTRQLQPLNTLFQSKEQYLTRLINGLHINDVREDAAFQASVDGIKERILLKPVTIEEPTIGEHRSQTKGADPYHNPGGTVTVHTFPLNFPVTGSAEILRYRTGEALTSANVYTSGLTNGGSFYVNVETEAMSREQVRAKANEEIAVTQTLIGQNNPQVEAWSQRISAEIDRRAAEKRKELIDFHGG